jgi:hypothetical protein
MNAPFPSSCVNQGVWIKTTVFTSSSTYQPSPGLMSLVAECIGGGGASGALGAFTASDAIGSGGGGSGGYSRVALPASLVAGQVSVTIGAGGVGGITDGPAGGATSFGPFCVANGGQGGQGSNATTESGSAGFGGAVGVGDFTLPGNDGEAGDSVFGVTTTNSTLKGGRGGSMWGGANYAVRAFPGTSFQGGPGKPNTGAGGGGSVANQIAGIGYDGLDGGSGVCIVTEYLWADLAGGGGTADCGQARVAIGSECFDPQGWMR